jgi:hypothetical protein
MISTLFSISFYYSNSHVFIFELFDLIFIFFVFSATFSNILAISWRPVSVVEETGVPGENHRPWASNW